MRSSCLLRTSGSNSPSGAEVEALWAGDDEPQRTILVVDDDADIGRLTARMLRKAGYNVMVATSGGEAIEIAGSPPRFDLVVSDIVMPDMDGITLGDRLQQMHPATQVLFMSGYTADYFDDLGPERSLALLMKPFDRETLLASVARVLHLSSPAVGDDHAGDG